MTAKRRIITIVAGVAAGAVAYAIAYVAATNGVKALVRGDPVDRQIERFASDMNKVLPKQVDEFTRWDRVETGPGKSYAYVYTISKSLTEEEQRAVTEHTTRQALATPEMQGIFAAGITVWYKYYDSAGRKVLEFPVKK